MQAKTGTGKTLCFLIPIAERLSREPQPLPSRSIFGLVLTPTRELAQQIHSQVESPRSSLDSSPFPAAGAAAVAGVCH